MIPSTQIKVRVSMETWDKADALLGRLPILVRGSELSKALTKGGSVVVRRARQLVTPPGYPGDKPDKKPLRDTISTVIRQYKNGMFVLVIGPQYPAGAHGHLVEFGHRIASGGTLTPLANRPRRTAPKSKLPGRTGKGITVGIVPPHPFMEPAFQDTKDQIEPLIISALQKAVAKAETANG